MRQAQSPRPDSVVSDRVKLLTRGTQWKQVAAIPMQFDTQHPQGMVKIGDDFYLSSVEIKTPTKRFPQPVDGYDRDTGEGAGHLFKFDKTGKLLADLPLGEGSVYHPGGIDYDGRYIWVPVAEYRPNSASIVYRVDPATMKATEVFRFKDHVGGIVHNTDAKTLHGVSWGSRRFYRFTLDDQGRVTNAGVPPAELAQDEQVRLHRLPGLQVPRPQRDAVLGPQQLPDEEGRRRASRSAASRSSTCAPTR